MSSSSDPKTHRHDRLSQWATLGSLMAIGGIVVLSARIFYTRFLKRIPSGDHVTPAIFAKRRWIKGTVTSVGDADGFRLYHTPCLRFRKVPTALKDLKGRTISIRIAGVDAPEGAHFGREAQPFSAESHAWLKNKILRKKVLCQLLHRDQYSRIVANVRHRHWYMISSKNLALEMLQAGWATTYEQSSAQYGKEGKAAYVAAEKKAKAKRLGMWKHGTTIETPAEYKRRHAEPAETRSHKSQDEPSTRLPRRPQGKRDLA